MNLSSSYKSKRRGHIKFSEYKERTPSGKKKVDCWSNKNKKQPYEVSISSGTKIWFDCEICSHDFESVLSSITRGNWCPYCSNKRLCDSKDCSYCFNKSFASYEGLTSSGKRKVHCWSNKNKKHPRELAIYSNKKFWFDCDTCPHDFESSLNKVSHKNYERWCPYCAIPVQKLCDKKECNFCLNKSFASYEGLTSNGKKKVHCWSNINNISPRNIAISSSKKFWFKCDVCPHNFESSLANIKKGQWCPYCAIPVKKLCGDKDCSYCLNKSFASYKGLTSNGKKKVDCWSNKNKRQPHEVAICIGKKIWFDCDTCPHDFQSVLSSITNNCWCPYCAIPVKKLCGDKDCSYCLNKSFAKYEGLTGSGKKKVDCWSNKNKKQPHEVSISSDKIFWFDCDTCPHDFKIQISNITNINQHWCSYCSNQKLCLKKDCSYCLNKSFASYEGLTSNGKKKVDCWSNKNEEKPEEVFKSSGKKYWFNCDVCFNDFDMGLNSIIVGRWCRHCKNKTELKLYNWLLKLKENNTEIKSVKKEFKPEWCSTKFLCSEIKDDDRYQYRFDFLIIFKNSKKLIIELDGPQHFKQISNWKPPLHNQIRDKYKEFKAKKHNIDVIRLLQEDVYYDRNNWEVLLLNILKKYKN